MKIVTIPSTVNKLEHQAFAGCNALESITCYATTPPTTSDDAFNHFCDLYVPKGTKAAYEADAVWSKFNIIDGIPDRYQTDISGFDNVLYIEPITIETGGAATVSVKMKNTAEIQTIGLYITLPEGVTVDKNSRGQYLISLSNERTDNEIHSLSKNYVDGDYRVGIWGFEGLPFEGNDGEIFTMSLIVSADMEEGDYSIILSNIELTDVKDVSYKPQNIKTKLTVTSSATRVDGIVEQMANSEIYNLTGLKQQRIRRGINIVRTAQGVKKIYVK